MRLKGDVRSRGLLAPTLLAIIVAERLWLERFPDVPFVITSLVDGKHGKNSLHFSGCAVDIRTKNLITEFDGEVQARSKVSAYVQSLRSRLASDYDVVAEYDPWHIHIEWQPEVT